MRKRAGRLAGFGLALSALGIVYGDIGTSPLYAINEIFIAHNTELQQASILGAISLVLWALTLVVAIKYVCFVLRADNQGEGGVFALLGLLQKHRKGFGRIVTVLLVLAAGLLFGDGIITPAISVLSAVEGLKVATPGLASFVVPITLAILTVLFVFQRKGTHKVGQLFGPIILLWFLIMGVLGVVQIVGTPQILQAFNPLHALYYLTHTPLHHLLLVIGSVMLVVTGGEALYADMGHFGKRPIRQSWFVVVYPMLLLGYLGQGAYLLSGAAVRNGNVFFSMVPGWALFPMILLATAATIIASQALISGAFSLAAQGMNLGLLPRLNTVHTHAEHEGQIYVPAINWLLYVGCIMLVIAFGSSTRLASAYGLGVSIDMVITSLAMIVVAAVYWRWRIWQIAGLFAVFLAVDLMFLSANSIKIIDGGYIPIAIALAGYIVMTTWRWGRARVRDAYHAEAPLTMKQLVRLRKDKERGQFPRSLLLLTPDFVQQPDDKIPSLLQIFIDRYHALPRHIINLTVNQVKRPHVDEAERFDIVTFENNWQAGTSVLSIRVNVGFMETVNLGDVIQYLADDEALTPGDDLSQWILYAARERLSSSPTIRKHNQLRYKLFRVLARNASPSYQYYGLGNDLRISVELIPVVLS